ncbi:gliding motility lipoprotein GldD [Psychroserpens jangbogonensis]|uniref:gliding motility lipoprotein GldD n=1 Tax=Psychroserpens jangbogonensis TaxID=1484460 RepID=UPI00053E2311|nr:gliding motility lipoprotein GldD [Psychroserpens jangbogonensis]
MRKFLLLCIVISCIACGSDPIPKPKAMLRLEYPQPTYKKVGLPLPFTFEKNELAAPISKIKLDGVNNIYGVDINYPKLKGTVYLTYKKVKDNNLTDLLRDAQNLTQKHTMKADEIEGDIYENPENNVFGMFYEVGGNAASQSQFYVTDSINHFLVGSLYFYAKPNYDSIYPAAVYLKNDIKHIMESIEWKN